MRWVGSLVLLAACSLGANESTDTDSPELGDTESETAASSGPGTQTATTTDPGSGTSSGGIASSSDTERATASGSDGTGAGTVDDSSGGSPGAGCQNGTVDDGEQCDDGNDVNGDGCNRDCRDSAQLFWETTASSGFGLVDEGFAVAPEADGSMVVAGYVVDAANTRSGWMRRYGPAGGEVWNTTMTGPGPGNNEVRGLVSDGSGNVYAAGYQNGPMGEAANAWLQKLDLDGNVVWTDVHNGAASGGDIYDIVTLDALGNVLVAGYTAVADSGLDALLRKYSSTGALLWSRTRVGANGGTDLIWDVQVSPAGHIYVAGQEVGPVGEGINAWLAKFDTDGNEIWSRSFNGPDSANDYLNGITVTGNDDVIVCGYEEAVEYPWHTVVRRYDPLGMIVWTDKYAGSSLEGAHCFGIKSDTEGNVVIVGGEIAGGVRNVLVRKYDPAGTVMWSTLIPSEDAGPDYGRDVSIGPDDTIAVIGARNFGVDDRDVWLGLLTP